MEYISRLLLVGIISLLSITVASQNVVSVKDSIFGQWKYEKHYWWKYSKYTQADLDTLKVSLLQVCNDKIYYQNIGFIDTCQFLLSDIKATMLFNKNNEEYFWYENSPHRLLPSQFTGPLALHYSKDQLSKIEKLNLGCDYGLGILYIKSDTIILNYLSGLTLFLTKVDDKMNPK